jgi:galactokinase
MTININSSAPGRICLFGEHQDYLGFPVIAAAIDLRMTIDGEISVDDGDFLFLELPDIHKALEFGSENIHYHQTKDYLKSTVNVLKRKGLYTPGTIGARFQGNVPIQAGTSSSAALSVAWAGFLLRASAEAGKDVSHFLNDPAAVAELAYLAEVTEFNESGGRMDQYASALGGIVYLDFQGEMTHESLPLTSAVKEFVLGDSRQPKDTQKTLKRVRTAQEEGFKQLASVMKFSQPFDVMFGDAEPFFPSISTEIRPYLHAALMNHRITNLARQALASDTPDVQKIADLMNRHQRELRDGLKISTSRIDTMIDAAMNAGALAGKINGSGEGGCMFAFCPGKQHEVAEAIERAGGVPYIINIGEGLRTESSREQ